MTIGSGSGEKNEAKAVFTLDEIRAQEPESLMTHPLLHLFPLLDYPASLFFTSLSLCHPCIVLVSTDQRPFVFLKVFLSAY